jgi:hypothetical protein
MAADAELFARAAMASRARHRIDPRLNAVRSAAPRGDPSRRMRIASAGRDARALMALDARALAVAARTESGLGARFVGVTRFESGAMKPGQFRIVERDA